MSAANGKITPLRVARGGLNAEALPAPPPASIEAEEAVLGSALMSKVAARVVAERLRPGDFSSTGLRRVQEVVSELATSDQAVDVLTVPQALEARYGPLSDDDSWVAFIGRLTNSTPTAAHVDDYARIVIEQATRREMLTVSDRLRGLALDPEQTLDQILDDAHLRMERVSARRHHRQLQGGITAAELMLLPDEELRWIVEGMFCEGLCILVGKGKQGKSWMCYQIAVAIAAGGIALDRVPVQGGRVLYLALEDTNRRLKRRLRRILAHGEKPPENLHLYTRWPRMQEGGQRALMAWFRQHPDTRVVFIDTFAKVRSVSERPGNAYDEDYRAMTEIKDVADAHGATIVVVHHFNKLKPTDDWVDSVSGSIGISGAADGIIGFFRERSTPTATLKRAGRDLEDETDLYLKWHTEGGPWGLTGDDPETLARTDAEQKILAFFRDNNEPARPAAVATAIDGDRATVKTQLWRLAGRGILNAHEGGFYTLAAQFVSGNEAVPVTDVSALPRYRVTGNDSNAVTPVTETDRVTPVTRNGAIPPPDEPPEILPDLVFPIGMEKEERTVRQDTWRLANALRFPKLADPISTTGGEGWYRTWCLDAPTDDVRLVYAALERLARR